MVNSGRTPSRLAISILCLVAAALLVPGAARAESLVASSFEAAEAGVADCTSGPREASDAVQIERVDAPGLGMLHARLAADSGDWDLAVFDSETGRIVAASVYPGSEEIASGFVAAPTELIVQACRASGDSESADVSVDFTPIEEPDSLARPQLVQVQTPTEADAAALAASGLDVSEHGGPVTQSVISYGPMDLEELRGLGLSYDVVDQDLLADSLEIAAEDADATAARGAAQSMPSGQQAYRHLFEYVADMKQLAKRNPKLVRMFKLKNKTYEGRPVMAIEIAANVKRKDGRPTFLQMGAHHAREWPSSEHAIEFAYQLVNGWKSGDKRIKRLMKRSRTVVVPIVNPDGFETSREAPSAMDDGRDEGDGSPEELANLALFPYEYQRKNCRLTKSAEAPGTKPRKGEGNCAQMPALGLSQFGVDPNRNYGGFWGGPGATPPGGTPPGDLAQDYRGPGPFSEPETRNVKALVSKRQVTTLITNHTFSDLVLRPPGLQAAGRPIDEKVAKRLGAAMAAENGYLNLPSYKLYDTTGGTEDWSYYATGGLGYTFEIGCSSGDPSTECPGFFHPSYADTVAQYNGTSPESGNGDGNREAYLKALAFAGKPKGHSVIKGTAPAGAKLTLQKRFKTPTSPIERANGTTGKVRYTRDHLKTKLKVRRSGRFVWDVNPSTRPLVAKEQGRRAKGKPSKPKMFSGSPADAPVPCPTAELSGPTCWSENAFTVPSGKRVDNFGAEIRAEWASPSTDWDMEVYLDGNGDGDSQDGADKLVGSSGNGVTSGDSTSEEVNVTAPVLKEGGKYVVRMVNFAATEPYEGEINFRGSPKFRPAKKERWKLTCRSGGGKSTSRVYVKRGQVKRVNLRRACG
ncbi:peptidase M14 [Thermoleophilia bacterium SCSIO 60948]|nr:peptidase M14 [Thermoleophilia bacterium SCSIO 60948]